MPSSQFFRFVIVGGIAFFVDAGLLLLTTEWFGLIPEIGRIISFCGAVTTTWYLNRTFTFATVSRPTLREFASYVLAMSFGLAVNYAVFVALIRLNETAGAYPVIALVPATLAGMVINFLFSRRILGSGQNTEQ
ncbi:MULTISPECIES: GtrA family protein [unclassified Ruegeria]|uniref:GtrA family protein n=1 Tax=unclassified Ruegeria TaxID=2625375 RepID=UPI00148A0B46|nr:MULTISPECIES: GtrA family protein [unclassified Ruegeria]